MLLQLPASVFLRRQGSGKVLVKLLKAVLSPLYKRKIFLQKEKFL